jgi:hypothetical protein
MGIFTNRQGVYSLTAVAEYFPWLKFVRKKDRFDLHFFYIIYTLAQLCLQTPTRHLST